MLRASELVLFDGRTEVARHERATVRGSETLLLDHYLEVLVRKPGALRGATALVQARAAGTFTAAHEAFWAAARKAHGDAGGTRALVEVLLLHRHHAHADVVAGITAALAVGAVSPDVVAVETRKHAQQQAAPAAADPVVVSLRSASPGRAHRPAPAGPATATVGRGLRQPAHRNEGRMTSTTTTSTTPATAAGPPAGNPASRPSTPRSTAPPGCCACRRSGTATARSPTPPAVSSCPTGRSCPSCSWPSATTATNAAPPAASPKPASRDPRPSPTSTSPRTPRSTPRPSTPSPAAAGSAKASRCA